MTLFQLLMLGASAFFAYKIYEHIQTLQDPQEHQHAASGETDEDRLAILIAEADAMIEKGEYQRALAIYSEAEYKGLRDAELLFKKGYALAQEGRNEEALEYYKEALLQDSKAPFIHQALASLYRKMGMFEKAKEHLEYSLELDNTNAVSYFNFGNLLVDMKQYEEAKKMYQKALVLDATLTQAQEELQKLQDRNNENS